MKNLYHEQEIIMLSSKKYFSRILLHEWLKKNGYKSEDDFYYVEHKEKVIPWQGETLLTLDVLLDDKNMHETEDDISDGISSLWNNLKISYLMATRPRCFIPALIKRILDLTEAFDLRIEFNLKSQTISSLEHDLNDIADKLDEEWGAGSEALAIMIQLEYQK